MSWSSADAIAAVRDGRCHLAIGFAYSLAPQPDVPGLVSPPLIDEPSSRLPKRWRGERQPIALKRLAREDWIIGSRQTDDRQLAERACALAGFAPRMTHTIDDYDLMLRMVAAGSASASCRSWRCPSRIPRPWRCSSPAASRPCADASMR